jgi:hypothetical protein
MQFWTVRKKEEVDLLIIIQDQETDPNLVDRKKMRVPTIMLLPVLLIIIIIAITGMEIIIVMKESIIVNYLVEDQTIMYIIIKIQKKNH